MVFLPLPPAAWAQEDIPAYPLDEFRHEGGTLVCFTDKSGKGYLPCLRIGRLAVGMTVGEIEEEIKKAGGRFEETHLGKRDAETRLYSLPAAKTGRERPELVVAYSDGVAEALQLSGKEPSVPLAFSSIHLGDGPLKVVGLIGPAFSTEVDPVTGGTLWEYGPFPFRIEFRQGKVYSIYVGKKSN